MSLTQALKAHSSATHDHLDKLIMSKKPFDSIENYGKFLQAQYAFHQAVLPIYQNAKIAQKVDNLQSLSRFERVKADMQALNITPIDDLPKPNFSDDEAVGWLYCVEGSNVGAAILYKEAGKIDLNDTHGASHLAAHADGRMPHWRAVKAQIDALELTDEQQKAAMKGADDAFAYFTDVVKKVYA